MKKHIEWLEEKPLRMRKYLSVFTAYIWGVVLIISIILDTIGHGIMAIFSIVTAQFATVLGFYMLSNAKSDLVGNDVIAPDKPTDSYEVISDSDIPLYKQKETI